MSAHTIFCFVDPEASRAWAPDVVGLAMTADGDVIASHVSSSPSWARRDLTSAPKQAVFAERYRDGYEVEWVDDEARVAELCAIRRNRTATS